MSGERWTVKRRRAGTVHIVRWWEVYRDGELIDCYAFENGDIAQAYVDYMNDPPEGYIERAVRTARETDPGYLSTPELEASIAEREAALGGAPF